jgi:hypothetical protein
MHDRQALVSASCACLVAPLSRASSHRTSPARGKACPLSHRKSSLNIEERDGLARNLRDPDSSCTNARCAYIFRFVACANELRMDAANTPRHHAVHTLHESCVTENVSVLINASHRRMSNSMMVYISNNHTRKHARFNAANFEPERQTICNTLFTRGHSPAHPCHLTELLALAASLQLASMISPALGSKSLQHQ